MSAFRLGLANATVLGPDGGMKSAPIIGLICAVLAGAATAAAQTPPHPVSELVVEGGPSPKVVASFPADGAQVDAGVLIIKLVFDQAMTAEGWSYGKSEGGAFPACLAKPRLLADQRTFVLLCTVAAHQAYALEVNASPAFLSAGGRVAKPTRLTFSTTDTGVRVLQDALERAGLSEADEPVMTWRDDGTGVSRSPAPAPDTDSSAGGGAAEPRP